MRLNETRNAQICGVAWLLCGRALLWCLPSIRLRFGMHTLLDANGCGVDAIAFDEGIKYVYSR